MYCDSWRTLAAFLHVRTFFLKLEVQYALCTTDELFIALLIVAFWGLIYINLTQVNLD